MSTHEIVGRDRELAVIDRFFSMDRPGVRALSIEGVAGVGKTTLWRQALIQAAPGVAALSCRPAEPEAHLTFAALHDLLAPSVRQDLGDLLPPRRLALALALALDDTAQPEESADDLALSLAVMDLLRIKAERGGVLVAIDDAQWVDPASARALEFAFRRLHDCPIWIIVARRTDGETGPFDIERALPSEAVTRLEVEPLSVAALHHLIRLDVGSILPRPQLLRVHEASGGIPLYALEMARSRDRSAGSRVGTPLAVPPRLEAIIDERIAEFPPDVAFALAVLAASRRRSLAEFSVAFGEGFTMLLSDAKIQALLVVESNAVRPSHPLWASRAYANLGPDKQREIHRRLASATEDIEERARHLFLATEGGDPLLAAELELAARNAAGRGAAIAAGELMEMSLLVTPPDEPAHVTRALSAADYHFASGDLRRSRELLQTIIDGHVEGPDRSDALWRLGVLISRSEAPPVAIGMFEQALQEAGLDTKRRLVIESWLASCKIAAGDFVGARGHAEAASGLARSSGDHVMEAVAATHFAVADMLLGGGYRAELWGLAVTLGEEEDLLPFEWQPTGWHAMALKWADSLPSARECLTPRIASLEERGDEGALPIALYHAAELECWAGRWDVAEEYAIRACDIAEQSGQQTVRSFALYPRALVVAYRGQVDEARGFAEEGLRIAEQAATPPGFMLNASVLGFIDLTLGAYEACHQRLAPLVQVARFSGVGEPGVFRFLPDVIEALTAVGEVSEASEILDHFENQARSVGRVWGLGAAARCRALLRAGEGDLSGAAAAASEARTHLESVEMPFELGRTLLIAGQIERRAKRKAAARELFQEATTIFEGLGAALWTEKAVGELKRTGTSAAGGPGLTPTEQRIAELVAAGKTNREVAEEMFVSPKTVEANLSRIYRKMGVRSRTELAAKLK
ncbi:MAG TPA: LuxR C-terminal-related transcriptional regulator [Actinomycetota bacterium]|nr:LuxR C-terminal-related transcriptional regulator [Actinomycetota bacterium]